MTDRPILRGQREICSFAGLNWKKFSHFRRNEGLPAWRHRGGKIWLACPEDLTSWIKKMRDKELSKRSK